MNNEKNHLKRLLQSEDGTLNMVSECLRFVNESENIIIFGAGIGGAKLYELLERNQLQGKISCFSDNNVLKHETFYCGKIVISPEDLKKYTGCFRVIVASSAYPEIRNQLLALGFKEEAIKLFNFAFSEVEYTDRDYIFNHIDEFDWTYQRLKDYKSKQIYENLLNYKITKDNTYLDSLTPFRNCEEEQYFDDTLVTLGKDEVFVDIGSYTGDTLDELIKRSHGHFEKYYGFEADTDTYRILKKHCDSLFLDNLFVYNLGAWDKNTKLEVMGSGAYGSFSFKECLDGGCDAIALDNILKDTKVTYIKMDIEGAEWNALCGLRKTISRFHPKLAICVYHKRDDYFRIPKLIEEISPKTYDYYIRQYRYTPTETVLYAIPRNAII